MQPITENAYRHLRAGADVLESDKHGEKVLRLKDGSFLKLFRRKRFLSSALLWPYAKRFALNCKKLDAYGVPSPKILSLYKISNPTRDIVHYTPLPGTTLRDLRISSKNCPQGLFTDFGRFVARLHAKGIYFRSIHLGNVVLTPDSKFGLIDVADLKFYNRELSHSQCLRNFKHMLRDNADAEWIKGRSLGDFVEGYTNVSNTIKPETLEKNLYP